MKVTFLGTGTSQGIPVIGCQCAVCQSDDARDKRLRVSILIEIDGQTLVVDTGPDFRQQMLSANVKKVDAVLITHEHQDHIAGLDDVRPFNFRYEMDMPVYAHPRVQQRIKQMYSYIFEATYPGVPRVLLHDIDKDAPFRVNNTKVTPVEVMHGKLPVLGFRIANFAYLTDTKTISDAERQKLQNLDVLVISALHQMPHHSHLTLEESIALIDELKPKHAYLTHLSHYMGRHAETLQKLPDYIDIAYDGLQINI